MNGYIVKGIGGFYYVKTPDGIVECKPRGIFRKQKITPVAGDEVTLETENGAAVIAQIAPRKNVFVRPPVANLDVLFLVASTTQPTPSTLVLDKLSAIAVDKGVQPVVVCTKSDLAEADFLANAYAKSTLPFIRIDYESGAGLDEVKQWINGRLCAFCGNSGVGKSTLLSLLAGLKLPTEGEITLDEQPIRLMDRSALRRDTVSVIYQDFNLFPLLTAEENVCYPLRLQKMDKEKALELARQRGALPQLELWERAFLARLRAMTETDYAALPDVAEGLEHRLYRASRTAKSPEELLTKVKTKRYTHARLRRILLAAMLELPAGLSAVEPPYLRVLGFTAKGAEILNRAKGRHTLPLSASLAELERTGETAARFAALETRAADLYHAFTPGLAPCGSEYTTPVIKI